MSTDPTRGPSGTEQPSGQPSEEELRAAYEAELSRITSTDMIAQAAVSLLNVAARRLGPVGQREQDPAAAGEQAGERDLEQARDAIDAVRALLEILERRIPQELGSLREALAQLQMAYAREAGAGAGVQAGTGAGPAASAAGGEAAADDAPAAQQPPGGAPATPHEDAPGAGPAVSSGRLWVPGR